MRIDSAMNLKTQIASSLTIKDWQETKKSLERDFGNASLWQKAFEFFEKRITTRYLCPIEAIEQNLKIEGEGFAITAIICSLVEALESFRQGKTYRWVPRGTSLGENEYSNSGEMFEKFLVGQKPFSIYFSTDDLASDFYKNVRCAVLHEAATRNGWKIRVDTATLVENKDGAKILNRKLFVDEIQKYLEQYKAELLMSSDLKKAFIRKMDSICETA